MVEAKHMELLGQILDLLDTACQASLELLATYGGGKTGEAGQLLSDLRAVTGAIASAQEPILPALEHAYTKEMLENVADTLDDIEKSIDADNAGRAAMKMEFQLFPFLRQLKEAFYFWGAVYPDKEKMAQYYKEEFAYNFRNLYVQEGEEPRYKLSIVVPAYNHLNTTKQCIEHLLKETDFEKLNAELILIDHGSTDGTLEYFEGLGVGKVIHFKHNVRMYMVTLCTQVCQGQYVALVSNDVLVTKSWAENLLACLGSDPEIIVAVPTTPNISNNQAIAFPTMEPEAFTAWAAQYNHSDPALWNDRARALPPVAIYRTSAVNRVGFADPVFYSREYYDDDFSLRARRAGYRQLVCDDVACYHFGSVTGKAAQANEGTLQYGRELFLQKNGVDAWGTGFCYDFQAVQLLKQTMPAVGPVSILGVDCGMGDTLLQIRNGLRRQHRECGLYHLTCEEKYRPDLAIFPNAAFTPDLVEGISSAFEKQAFSVVYIGRMISEYEGWRQVLAAIRERLAPGGCAVFACDAPYHALTLHALLSFTLPEGAARCVLADPEKVKQGAEQIYSQVQMLAVENPVNGIEDFARQHYGKGPGATQIAKKLAVSRYYYICRR